MKGRLRNDVGVKRAVWILLCGELRVCLRDASENLCKPPRPKAEARLAVGKNGRSLGARIRWGRKR